MQAIDLQLSRFDLEGVLPLDFSNTADWHASPTPEEELHSYEDLAAWGAAAGLYDEEGAAHLIQLSQKEPDRASRVLAEAIELRESIFRIFSTISEGETPAPGDLEILNGFVQRGMAHRRMTLGPTGIDWAWSDLSGQLDRMLWPIAISAAELLTSDQVNRVGMCADDRGCGWLFLDTSRNRSRRWCSMDSCGNRAKAHRHYGRTRKEKQEDQP